MHRYPTPTAADFLAHGWSPESAEELAAHAKRLAAEERRHEIRDEEHLDHRAEQAAARRSSYY
jgi:hypothetical protein